MKLAEFPFLADENIDPDVVLHLRESGLDVADVVGEQLGGATDATVLARAFEQNRVVLTHDSDFGALAVRQNQPIVGIVYLRPGHIDSRFTIETLETVFRKSINLVVPFLIVARRHEDEVTVRIRPLGKNLLGD